AALLLSPASATEAQTTTTYYVATDGSDSNAGTEALPFRTLVKGVTALHPGDTLLVKQGTYHESLEDSIPTGLSWLQPVTLRAYPGHQVIIMPDAGAQFVIRFHPGQHHIILDGFILDGTNVELDGIKIAGHMGSAASNPSHIRIINNEIRNVGATKTATNGYTAYGHGILTTGNSTYIEYINNHIHDNGLTDFDHGIYHLSSYALIEENTIYNNKGTGIKVGWGQNASYNIVRSNIVYDNNTAQGANGVKKQGRGIGVYYGSGTQVYNNVIWGAHMSGIDVSYSAYNAKIYNNTIYSTDGYGIVVGFGPNPADTARNAVIQNNVVSQAGDQPAIYNQH
ncbi:MAG: right-handed parallel beta-helix repeat-containing protein, partial [Anaerolineae bacterium]|nr:right-handed parallel beta-helix repeat-containing protein [Anaerolineae bacterium]